jgi:hypothetical protein
MYEPNSEILERAAQAAERLIGFYPTITASAPKIYAAGLVQLFSRYPEHLVAEAIDPVNGLPAECDNLPSIAKVKSHLEPRLLSWQKTQDKIERAKRKPLPEPPRDPQVEHRIVEGFKKLSARLKNLK